MAFNKAEKIAKNNTFAQATKNMSTAPIHAVAPNTEMATAVPGAVRSKKEMRKAAKANKPAKEKKAVKKEKGVKAEDGQESRKEKDEAEKEEEAKKEEAGQHKGSVHETEVKKTDEVTQDTAADSYSAAELVFDDVEQDAESMTRAASVEDAGPEGPQTSSQNDLEAVFETDVAPVVRLPPVATSAALDDATDEVSSDEETIRKSGETPLQTSTNSPITHTTSTTPVPHSPSPPPLRFCNYLYPGGPVVYLDAHRNLTTELVNPLQSDLAGAPNSNQTTASPIEANISDSEDEDYMRAMLDALTKHKHYTASHTNTNSVQSRTSTPLSSLALSDPAILFCGRPKSLKGEDEPELRVETPPLEPEHDPAVVACGRTLSGSNGCVGGGLSEIWRKSGRVSPPLVVVEPERIPRVNEDLGVALRRMKEVGV